MAFSDQRARPVLHGRGRDEVAGRTKVRRADTGSCVREASCGIIRGMENENNIRQFRKSLRNENINYRNGWFFVTCQIAHNKSILGAIVGERCELNELGQRVEAYWRGLPAKYPELELDEFVVMPNHFHAILRIRYRPTNKEHRLGFLMSRFKGGTGYIYGKMRRAGEVEDIGEHLWQLDFWDKIVTSEEQLAAYRKYIRENPKNWSRDRFGAVTQYSFGNLEILRGPRIAFVASQGFLASELRPKMVWRRTEVRRADMSGGEVCRSDMGRGGCIGARGFSLVIADHIDFHECPGTRSSATRTCQGPLGNQGRSSGAAAQERALRRASRGIGRWSHSFKYKQSFPVRISAD